MRIKISFSSKGLPEKELASHFNVAYFLERPITLIVPHRKNGTPVEIVAKPMQIEAMGMLEQLDFDITCAVDENSKKEITRQEDYLED